MTIINEHLEAIRKRAEAATEGPWFHSESLYVISNVRGDSIEWTADVVAESEVEADAEFIAHAREDVPALLAEVKRLRCVIARCRCEECGDELGDYWNDNNDGIICKYCAEDGDNE